MGRLPDRVSITEVGLRDGLQIEKRILPPDEKLALAKALIDAGHTSLEVTSFVSPARVPQLADAADVLAALGHTPGVELKALVPNIRGAERALAAKADVLVFVLSATDTHGVRNLNRSSHESLAELREVVTTTSAAGARIDVSLSVAFGCPFEGDVPVEEVIDLAGRIQQLGVSRMSFCDTTGMATPRQIQALAEALRERLPELDPAFHFHNTRGLGLVGVLVALQEGIVRFESSVGGLGGCPFAPSAAGNVCTEDMVHMLHEIGIETGLDLTRLMEAARLAEQFVGRTLDGQVMKSGPRLHLHGRDGCK
ncbi:hydroxymethylglutaryl-CoA lyase [Microvirga sp. CF3062]|uniref:hydroxymethylglutaryl-CoA lyase n=1 Tax=Microvirga sp. CF3062 TaxID=3110182 RepID=UPI002E76B4C4|nr:hydroxymethylglutaryl-CoA lyase [Microvirga sp. CF3062]MEE1655480.1 hydroxymethylglutaryl-CoA lyase [Microvirga sp. CF3062]